MLEKIRTALLQAAAGEEVLVVAASSFHVREYIRQAVAGLSDVGAIGAPGHERLLTHGGTVHFTTIAQVRRGDMIGHTFRSIHAPLESGAAARAAVERLIGARLDGVVTYVGGL